MVRVIPVHNFLEQNVAQIEEPTASCVVETREPKADYLLLALPSHCVEVRDLTVPELDIVTTFSTVDLPCQIIHCARGNYVATLESKLCRDGTQTNTFVRVYVNWATQEKQPMRARIASRVTPSLNRPHNCLEMIELPLNVKPTAIACCQTTGNMLVAAANTVILHEFKIETQTMSKMKFIDFEARPWSLGLHFSPTKLEIVEDFISMMDSSRFVVIRLTNSLYEDIDHLSSLTSTTSSNDKTTISTDFCITENLDDPISSKTTNNLNITSQENDFNQKNHVGKISNSCNFLDLIKEKSKNKWINWDSLANDDKEELESLINRGIIDQKSQPLSVNFPSICLERAGPGHTLNPFVLNSADTEVIIKTTSPDNGWSENYEVKNILRLKIARANDFLPAATNSEFFTSFVLKPLYMKINNNSNGLKKSILRSEKYKYFNGVTCLICTSQEGYIYHFNIENNENPACLTTYPFTAPVIHVSLEYTVLHALTEAGLESYTLRLPHHVAKKSLQLQYLENTCPDISEPVCLIGLRPFLGVQKLLSSDNFIVLLSKAENSWTLYSLRVPSPQNIYYDIVNAAENHRTSSPSTYRHLLEEAHTMLRLAKDIADFYTNDDDQTQNDSKLESLYRQSCALLGDYFVKSDSESERCLCIPYYKMSGLKPNEVLLRESTQNAPGLFTYVEHALKILRSGPEADAFFQSQDIVEMISDQSTWNLLKLILESVVLREYATEKLIKLLLQKKDKYSQLSLALLYVQAGKQKQAEMSVASISKKLLSWIMLEYPHLLFDEGAFDSRNQVILTFSDFAAILICCKTEIFAQNLTLLIQNEVLTLHQVILVFSEYLPSRIGRDGPKPHIALLLFLEIYLCNYFTKLQDKSEISDDFALIEALEILVRSYLCILINADTDTLNMQDVTCISLDDDPYPFHIQRPKYLDMMPPCAENHQTIVNATNLDEISRIINEIDNRKPVYIGVLKLQALMASSFLPAELLQEVEKLLDTEKVVGTLALRTLCNRNIKVNTQMLIEECPQAVLQYAKDTYTKEIEWKLFVDLLQQKISEKKFNQEPCLFFEQTMIDTIKYAAEVLPLKSLQYILPKDDNEAFQLYTEVCDQIVHAEHVKSLLMETSRTLLSKLKNTNL